MRSKDTRTDVYFQIVESLKCGQQKFKKLLTVVLKLLFLQPMAIYM